jgi:AraC-like DNA-binding protein
MNLQYFESPPELKPYIKVYIYYRLDNASALDPIKFLPSGNPYIVFNLEDPFSIENSRHRNGLLEDGIFAVGQQEAYYLLKPGLKYANFCIIFQPTGLWRLFNIPVHEITNDSIKLDYLTKNHLNRIMDQLREEKGTPQQTVKDLNAFFFRQLMHYKPVYPYIEYSIELIKQKKGLITVRELADLCNTCERNYRRRFLETTGLPPKKYITITRFRNIFHSVNTLKELKINWIDITFNNGYYDQMHFIKEFKKFCGESPSVFFSKFITPEKSCERSLNKVTT